MEIRLLGPLQVIDSSGGETPVRGERLRAIVSLLALEAPGWVSADRIVEAVWGESIADPEGALHVSMSRLRKNLGDGIITTGQGGYRLDLPSESVDVNRFRRQARVGRQLLTLGNYGQASEALRQALAQFRGSPLEDINGFIFADDASRVLEEERMSTVEWLMEAELAAGNHDLIVGELTLLVSRYPLRERLWEHLMVALYRTGRQSDALRAYARLKESLADLGIEPSKSVVDLEERILLHDPDLDDLLPAVGDPLEPESERITFGAGDMIIEAGTTGHLVYWIETGRVEVLGTGQDGEEIVLADLGPGRYFGELASLLGTMRTASVRAAEKTTVSAHTIDSFRRRLGVERGRWSPGHDRRAEVSDLIRRGEYLRAYDLASVLLERSRSDPELQYLAVLALARAGATEAAERRYRTFQLDAIDPTAASPGLLADIAALGPRLDKDLALADETNRVELAERSAHGYERAFTRHRSPYLSVNAATMWLLAGRIELAEASARLTLDLLAESVDPDTETYWEAATEAEAALILRDTRRAQAAVLRAAGLSPADPAARATTMRQLQTVCRLLALDPENLTPLSNRSVLHYCGHRLGSPESSSRLHLEDIERVRGEIEHHLATIRPGSAYGSLAAGADILFAEALLDREVDLHVFLPFDRSAFVTTSVAPAGEAWVTRFEKCIDAATTVTTADGGALMSDPTLFDFAAQLAMGNALIRAGLLESEALQLAIWDGHETDEIAGTAVDVKRWQESGRPTTVIPVPGNPARRSPPVPTTRRLATVVFGDFAGFSHLSDTQVVVFWEEVMTVVAKVLETHNPHYLFGNTWGDGVHFVFDDATRAADCLLDLQDAIRSIDFDALGLGGLRGLRLAAHTGPVFSGWDPISGKDTFFGTGMNQAARIEPTTPEGEVYVTLPFAALASLASDAPTSFQYVGTLPSGKGFGPVPLFSLKRRPGPIAPLI